MTVAILHCRAQLGVKAPPVAVEVILSGGLPKFAVVGLAEAAVRESKDRVRGAIQSSGFSFPQERIIVSLGPADMRKAGGRFDLPIALGILAASNQIPLAEAERYEFFGELALTGDVRGVSGMLPSALQAGEANRAVFVPLENAAEASIGAATVYPAESLLSVTAHLHGQAVLSPVSNTAPAEPEQRYPDLADVRGQWQAKRALEIAAAGGHNILFTGPPGTGKSMLAQRLPGILPPPTTREAIESAAIDSILGKPVDLANWRRRPFRAPHHTASAIALVGGGADPRPGEVSRAHNGVLFLDELPEFSRHVLEVLREPMESGWITISRASRQADYPARFQLVAAMNPCPCGYLGDPKANCRCSADRVANYRAKISGPLLDRIDIQVQVQRPSKESLRPDAPKEEPSSKVHERVVNARGIQLERNNCCNAVLDGQRLRDTCTASAASWSLLEAAMDRFVMSARAHQRIWRVARTIADLAESQLIESTHVGEALSLRYIDRANAVAATGRLPRQA